MPLFRTESTTAGCPDVHLQWWRLSKLFLRCLTSLTEKCLLIFKKYFSLGTFVSQGIAEMSLAVFFIALYLAALWCSASSPLTLVSFLFLTSLPPLALFLSSVFCTQICYHRSSTNFSDELISFGLQWGCCRADGTSYDWHMAILKFLIFSHWSCLCILFTLLKSCYICWIDSFSLAHWSCSARHHNHLLCQPVFLILNHA